MSLTEYNRKRDFRKTREPPGKVKKASGRSFVVQEHYASHHHFDFRLELNGVLKSWAVPKGISQKPKEKRLAVEVEDHPLCYGNFEGEIPEGEYGAGTVEIWDKGKWYTGDSPNKQLKKGHLEFELKGDRLKGRWMLIRTGLKASGKKHNWLLIKRSDDGLSLAPEKEVSKPQKKRRKKAQKKTKPPSFVEFQLCSLSPQAPSGENWIHEVKFDGYRTACRMDGKKIKLLTRRGLDWTDKYPTIAEDCRHLAAQDVYLDGEIVWVDAEGKTQFQGLQDVLSRKTNENILYYVFDIFHLNGEDLRDLPLIERKEILKNLLKKSKTKKVLFSEHWNQSGPRIHRASCDLGLEGIISKNSSKAYHPGRSPDWQKVKCKNAQEFVIGGFTYQKNGTSLGALLVGIHNKKGELQYVGKVGTGFNARIAGNLLKKLKKLKSQKTPFAVKSPREKGAQWVKPQLVANIEFGSWTGDEILRHAAFKGLREDKPAKAVGQEEVLSSSVELTNPDKILFTKAKITKAELANYYEQIQEHILPHISRRPLALLRCPDGTGKECFFQKHLQHEAQGVQHVDVRSFDKDKKEKVLFVESVDGIRSLVQMGALELHVRGSRADDVDRADLIVFDIDPDKSVSWQKVKDTALEFKRLLAKIGLKSFVKVTGGKGLHIHVPIEPIYDWDQVKGFAKTICEKMAEDNPTLYTTHLQKAKRVKKIFLDFLRNDYGSTAVVAYSARATPVASIALPITWRELDKIKSPDQFHLREVLKLLKKRRDPWPGYHELRQKIKLLEHL